MDGYSFDGWVVNITPFEQWQIENRGNKTVADIVPNVPRLVCEYFISGMSLQAQQDVFCEQDARTLDYDEPLPRCPIVRIFAPPGKPTARFIEMARLIDTEQDCTLINWHGKETYALVAEAVEELRKTKLVDDLLTADLDEFGNMPTPATDARYPSELNRELLWRSTCANRVMLQKCVDDEAGEGRIATASQLKGLFERVD